MTRRLTCRLQEVCSQAAHALAAPMTQVIALTAPAALGLFCASSHEPFHAHGGQESIAVTERSGQKPPQRRHDSDLPSSDRTVDQDSRSGRLSIRSFQSIRSFCRLHCRIKPYLDQAAPLRDAGPGVSAAAQPPKARAAHAGPRRKRLPDQHQLIRHADPKRAPCRAFPADPRSRPPRRHSRAATPSTAPGALPRTRHPASPPLVSTTLCPRQWRQEFPVHPSPAATARTRCQDGYLANQVTNEVGARGSPFPGAWKVWVASGWRQGRL